MWKRSEIDVDTKYQIALCQSATGVRTHALHVAGSMPLPVNTVFLTQAVPTDLLVGQNLRRIAEAVTLENGGRYWVDAHGVWLTREELDALEEEREIPWVNGIAAQFPPR